MATYPARQIGFQTTAYLRRPVTFAIGNTGIVQVGTLPAGSLVLRAYLVVATVFNAGTTNTYKVGTVGSDASLVASAANGMATLGTNSLTLVASAAVAPTADYPVILTSTSTGTVATTGSAYVVIEYAPVA